MDWLKTLKPNFRILLLKERLICGLGALIGWALSLLISWWILGEINAWYIARWARHLFYFSQSPPVL